MSGEPMPSSFSSARLLFGEEPLNSWGKQSEKWYVVYAITTIEYREPMEARAVPVWFV